MDVNRAYLDARSQRLASESKLQELTRIANTFTDHEQDVGDDFASTLGTGGVLGTKFTWPDYGKKFQDVYLNTKKEARWKRWIKLYNDKMLSNGNFLDVYVHGYDVPEAYAIEKGGHLYYAFYAPEEHAQAHPRKSTERTWRGDVELRGLNAETYGVSDYVHQKDFGTVSGPTARLKVEFTDSLLLEATPIQ
jgi:alpha-galactosidase